MLFGREAKRAGRSAEIRLGICLLRVGHLNGVARRTPTAVSSTGGVHSGGGITEALENGALLILVGNSVALEHTSLVLAGWVSLWLF